MWIERIDFAGFGSISGEKIEFKGDRLNLVVEPNEYGKSTIASAIWAILYGFSAEQKSSADHLSDLDARRPRPKSGLPFIASIDINLNDRRLKIIRDFSDNAVQVIDVGQVNKDVTREFRGPNGEDEVGMHICGMTREMFKSTCFVGQRDLDEHSLVGNKDFSALLKSIADSAATSGSAGGAIEIISETLTKFPYHGKPQKMESIIHELETYHQELIEKLNKLQTDKRALVPDVERIDELEQIIRNNRNGETTQPQAPSPSDHYFALALEAADLDNVLIHSAKDLMKVQEQRREQSASAAAASAAAAMESFPIESVKTVEDLWTRRNSRKADYDQLFSEVAPRVTDYEQLEKNVRSKWSGLENFTLEDGKQVGILGVTLRNLLEELNGLKRKQQLEMDKVQGMSIDLQQVDQSRKALLALDPRDFDDARSYMALLNNFKESIDEAEKAIFRQQQIMAEIEDQKKSKKGMFALPTGGRKKEMLAAEQETEKQQNYIQELRNKIVGLEVRLDTLARKSGMTNGSQLLYQLKSVSSSSANLKDLESVAQLISSREGLLVKTKLDLENLFEKAGRRSWEINPESAIELSEELAKYFEDARVLNMHFQNVSQGRQQLDFLVGEINDIEDFLVQLFAQAQVENTGSIETARSQYVSKLNAYQRQQGMPVEAPPAVDTSVANQTELDLLDFIEKQESARAAVWRSMQELVDKFPEIADTAPSMPPKLPGAPSTPLPEELDKLRNERDELIVKVRTVTLRYDENYPGTIDELEVSGRELHKMRRAKTALELARGTLTRLSSETYSDWSTRLNVIAAELVQEIGLDFDRLQFDADLRLQVARPGDQQPITAAQIESQLSAGAKEQLHWIARMILSRFLSRQTALPIILDEPFSEADDERFLKLMRFILDKFSLTNQIIVFSCHQMRHQWLISQLTAEQAERLEFVRRAPLRAPNPNAATNTNPNAAPSPNPNAQS